MFRGNILSEVNKGQINKGPSRALNSRNSNDTSKIFSRELLLDHCTFNFIAGDRNSKLLLIFLSMQVNEPVSAIFQCAGTMPTTKCSDIFEN